jgi:hypothetical protein
MSHDGFELPSTNEWPSQVCDALMLGGTGWQLCALPSGCASPNGAMRHKLLQLLFLRLLVSVYPL